MTIAEEPARLEFLVLAVVKLDLPKERPDILVTVGPAEREDDLTPILLVDAVVVDDSISVANDVLPKTLSGMVETRRAAELEMGVLEVELLEYEEIGTGSL